MLVGAMNHPARDVVQEITAFAQLGMDFVDLTLEPPAAAIWKINPEEVRRVLAELNLAVVGHTAFYLSIGSPFERIRQAAVMELAESIKIFARVGAQWMNIHPDGHSPFHPAGFASRRNLESLRELAKVAADHGVGLMVENVPGRFNSAAQLGEILDGMPELCLHLDIGHCNLMVRENTAGEILARYMDRIRHVHLHDNRGGTADLHLPLGAGTLDYQRYIRVLKQSGYNSTITLEVFTGNPGDLVASSRLLRQLWKELEDEPAHNVARATAHR
jgi:sugar phosphate isomerase/epimerase